MAANLVLFFVLIVAAAHETAAQENSMGIYLTVKSEKKYNNCPKKLFTRDKKTLVCVTPKPIIAVGDFSYLTEIRNDMAINFSYFNLVLSQQGFDKVKSIIASLPGAELVLVVDENVVGFIKDKNQIVNRSIRLDGAANSEDVQWLHKRLKEIVKGKNGEMKN
jgi:hypothetical protein